MINIGIITINSEFLIKSFKYGIISKALKLNKIKFNFWNPIDFISKKNKNIDGKIYGGGPGIVFKLKPLYLAIKCAFFFYKKKVFVIYLSAHGQVLNKNLIFNLLNINSTIIFICGRYNGIDQRIIDKFVDLELSIGDYILSCGEIPLLVVIDSLSRVIPGVLNNNSSVKEDSFTNYNGLLGFPYYTRPYKFLGMCVPKILLSGHHKKINDWKLKKSLKKTFLNKFYLFKKIILSKYQKKIFKKIKKKYFNN